MAYKVKVDGTTIPKQIGEKINRVGRVARAKGGEVTIPIYRTNVYLEGDVIEDEDVAPVIVKQYDDGDKHIRSLIERVGGQKKKSSTKK